jgi:hypothetical protein
VAGVQGLALAGVQVGHLQSSELVAVGGWREQHIAHPLLKSDLATQSDDRLADVLNHLDQFEGADVRVCGIQNVGGGAGIDELVHHLAAQVARVFDLAVELAVAERACTAFAKLHIALGVEHLFAPQAPSVFRALSHGFAPLEHDGFETHLRQGQRRKHAARPKAHHHRALAFLFAKMGWRLAGGVPCHVGRGLDVRVFLELVQQGGFVLCVGQRQIHDVDRQQVGLAGVKAAFEDVE